MTDRNGSAERWRSKSCEGERCHVCGEPAAAKAGEEIAHDDPQPHRHNLTAYLCAEHFAAVFGPAAWHILGRPT